MKNLRGLTTLVLGLGDSGLAMAAWCARHGAVVRVWDSRESPPQAGALALAVPGATLTTGALEASLLDGVQLILKSPGLAPRDDRIAARLAAARAMGVVVQGELDLFAQALQDLHADRGYTPDVLAITGTNGKTTTTALTALLVERCGRRVATAGNIGPTMLDTLAAALDAVDDDEAPLPLPEVWVLELSSFQLDGVTAFEPSAAAVLNVTQDHLDWHGSLDAYAGAKARVFGRWATMVINRDDPLVAAMVPAPVPVLGKGRPRPPAPRNVVRFGLDAPTRAGDFGLVVENGMAWLVRAVGDDDAGTRRRGGHAASVAPDELHLQRLMPADALRIRGRHNAANALAALALATSIGCPLAPMLHGLREYRGEPHRVAFVASVGGVEAFDDSKGTNVGATVAALAGLGADKAPGKLVVILGGDGKGQDFAPLAAPIAQHARAVATIGRDAAAIEAALARAGVPVERHATLEAAVAWCFAQAHAGDAVLLSPACASLDMFRNYAHRAEVFVDAVNAHAQALGEVAA
ncbi:MAG TPA: Mur ligase family protein [Burkholderiaceae bacterium]|nr:Mur ligase family protein [Burkholderiaceae bacterium]